MRPIDKAVRTYTPPPDLAPQTIDFRLIRNGQQVSSATLEQLRIGQGVHQIKVVGELHGILFLPEGSQPHPAVLVVGGSNGGVPAEKAAWLAGHGYAAFALAYFRYEDLPKNLEAIPLEYFGNALSWIRKRPEITPDRTAVLGISRGGELALQLGSMYPAIKAVVAYVPANVRIGACCGDNAAPYAWTWHGQPLSYLRGTRMQSTLAVSEPAVVLRAEIPVENTNGPILMIGGEEDRVWDSASMVEAAAGRLKRTHFAHEVEVLKYPHAGHLAGNPEITPAWKGPAVNPGGSVQGDAESSLDAIPKVLSFLRKSLEPTAATAAASK